MEWVWDTRIKRASSFQQKLEELLRQRIAQVLQQQNGAHTALFWKAATLSIQLLNSKFEYSPISPGTVGEMYYYANQSAGSEFLQPLEEYLHRYDELKITPYLGKPTEQEMVMLLPDEISLSGKSHHPALANILKLAKDLSRRGYRMLLVGHSQQSIGWIDGILFVGVEEQDALKSRIVGLGPIDILVSISCVDRLRINATRKVIYDFLDKETDKFNAEQELITLIQSAPIQSDYSQILRNSIKKSVKRFGKGLVLIKQYSFNLLQRIMSFLKV
jgi:hypothetical protein